MFVRHGQRTPVQQMGVAATATATAVVSSVHRRHCSIAAWPWPLPLQRVAEAIDCPHLVVRRRRWLTRRLLR